MSKSDAERIPKLAQRSLRDGDTARFLIQLGALCDVEPPEPALDIRGLEALEDARHRAWKGTAEDGRERSRGMTGKLVRDRIPEIIRAKGDRPVTRVADSGEYLRRLGDKLVEEAQEARDADREHQAAELADTLEVVYAIADEIGVPRGDLEKIREDKAAERGGFGGRIVWLGNEEPGE
jgi:predicted house-cleaning noncanonical NTP pyrophosphatase (MazG superfamily)